MMKLLKKMICLQAMVVPDGRKESSSVLIGRNISRILELSDWTIRCIVEEEDAALAFKRFVMPPLPIGKKLYN